MFKEKVENLNLKPAGLSGVQYRRQRFPDNSCLSASAAQIQIVFNYIGF